jgi:HEAT repeat protein
MQPSDDSSLSPLPAGENGAPDPDSNASLRAGLYIIPAMIVLLFVVGWLLLFWLFHEDYDPHSLVQGMQQPGRSSWQKAYALSQLLVDPANDQLKDDPVLCRALAHQLEQQNIQAEQQRRAGGEVDEELTQFRAYLCHALGNFRLGDALPPLLQCAAAPTAETAAASPEHEVRRAAMEAIAVLAGNIDTQELPSHDRLVDVLISASGQEAARSNEQQQQADIASAATFALGVIGGPRATEQLLDLITDGRTDVRYNAATGLARQSRPEAVPVLLEMLDLDNRLAYDGERTESARSRKQQMVLHSGIQACTLLLPAASPADRQQLITALQQLRDSPTAPARIRIDAQQALMQATAERR